MPLKSRCNVIASSAVVSALQMIFSPFITIITTTAISRFPLSELLTSVTPCWSLRTATTTTTSLSANPAVESNYVSRWQSTNSYHVPRLPPVIRLLTWSHLSMTSEACTRGSLPSALRLPSHNSTNKLTATLLARCTTEDNCPFTFCGSRSLITELLWRVCMVDRDVGSVHHEIAELNPTLETFEVHFPRSL